MSGQEWRLTLQHPAKCALDWVLEDIDYILIMSVNPGFGGQKFIENSLNKIRTLRQIITDRGYSTLIQIDGGVNKNTIGKIAAAGADIFVAGSAIYQSNNYKETIAQFRKLIAEAV
jgi:ribulose-phosphate 3-epimerase